jgi:hypothetical protein
MFIGILKIVGEMLGIIALVAFLIIPDPIGKIVEVWHFFRAD